MKNSKIQIRHEVRKASKKLLRAMATMSLIRATHPELIGCTDVNGRNQYFWPINDWLHETGYDLLWYLNWSYVGDHVSREALMPLVAYLMACIRHYEHWEEISLDIHPEKSWNDCFAAVVIINDNGWAAPHDDDFFEALKCLRAGKVDDNYYPQYPPAMIMMSIMKTDAF